MGISDRRYEQPGGDGFGEGLRRAFRRMFIEGDNFFSWALPLMRVPQRVPGIGGIEVRIHLLYIVFVIGSLIWAARPDAMGWAYQGVSIATLFVLVLIHEFGHCLACRWVGGEADRILMWPLGGLAECSPPHNWRASLITTLGGPATHLVIGPILAGVMLGLGAGHEVLVYNPLNARQVWSSEWFVVNASYWKYALWAAYNANAALFLFNMLLVMFPLDAGRVVQSLLWSRLGYARSMRIATSVGIGFAVVVGAYGFMSGESNLLGIAIFAGFTCMSMKRQLAFSNTGSDPIIEQSNLEQERYEAALRKQRAARRRAADRATDRAPAPAARIEELSTGELDRILEKIKSQGMGSLTSAERKSLEAETDRKRAGRR